MSSHNIDENAMLKFVCFCYQIWGIKYINRDTLKKSRQNSSETTQPLTNLLFDLAILQILDFSYTLTELGIVLPQDQQTKLFVQQFVLAYLSESNCPFLNYPSQDNVIEHSLDFGNSRILLLVVGWLMARIQFFGQIRNKYVVRKFNDLYIEKKLIGKGLKLKQTNTHKYKPQTKIKGYADNDSGIQAVQKLFRTLQNITYRSQCLQRKKSQIHARLSKQILQFNKKNHTNYKIDHILEDNTNDDEDIQREEDELEAILMEMNKGMKNQQYFWMWLQFKVVENQYKQLSNQFEDFEKIQGEKPKKWVRMNPDYLSMYNKQYKTIVGRMQAINTYMESIGPWLDSAKPIKNESAIAKQVQHQSTKMLQQQNPDLLQMIGTPCFLKLEVKKYCEKHGFGTKGKKKKKKEKIVENNPIAQQQLKIQLKEFLESLEQLKFM